MRCPYAYFCLATLPSFSTSPCPRKILIYVTVVAFAAWSAPVASASTNILQLDFVFSGSTPGGSPPWLHLTLEDQLTPNTVRATFTTPNLVAGEFVSGWYFNLNPAYDPLSLSFSLISNPTGLSLDDIKTGKNKFKADGDGKYDILLEFPTAAGPSQFTSAETLILDLYRAEGLSVGDFLYKSVESGGAGTYYSAAHIQGIGEDSAWVGAPSAIPEPETVSLLLGLASLPALYLRRLRGRT